MLHVTTQELRLLNTLLSALSQRGNVCSIGRVLVILGNIEPFKLGV